ncbi:MULTISPECIES: hypothetical protein [unclassified Bradyrhizobium]|nr:MULTISPECIES: hypothetical protein [unclassified Bradyrhizobium]
MQWQPEHRERPALSVVKRKPGRSSSFLDSLDALGWKTVSPAMEATSSIGYILADPHQRVGEHLNADEAMGKYCLGMQRGGVSALFDVDRTIVERHGNAMLRLVLLALLPQMLLVSRSPVRGGLPDAAARHGRGARIRAPRRNRRLGA